MSNNPVQLTMEQQFSIVSFKTQVEKMSLEQAKTMLIELYEHQLYKEATYKHLLKHDWGWEQ
jgi:hypothetical protein